MKKLMIAALAATCLAGPASAAAIVGSFDMVGQVQGINTTGGQISTATGLDFAAFGTTANTTNFIVFGGPTNTGVFAALFAGGTTGTLQDIVDFSTFTSTVNFFTTASAPSLAFDLNAPLSIQRDAGLNTLTVAGTGTFRLAGFDNTIGNWTLTTQGNGFTTFSASSQVPEPAMLSLFGLGIAGLGFARRRKAA